MSRAERSPAVAPPVSDGRRAERRLFPLGSAGHADRQVDHGSRVGSATPMTSMAFQVELLDGGAGHLWATNSGV